MSRNRSLYFSWLLGTVLVLFVFYAAVSWLWSAAEESSAASLEKQVISALSRDLAEGNLFKLGDTLSKLQRDGHLLSAEIRGINSDKTSRLIFRTFGAVEQTDPYFSEFVCGEQRKLISRSDDSVSLITTLPSNIAGIECAALFINSAFPPELKQFRRLILISFGTLLIIIFALFFWFTLFTYRKIIDLETKNKLMQNEKDAAIGRLAAQVAHDIRSPVFALEAALKNIPQLPERQRVVVRHAVNSIRDVANSLLEKTRAQAASAGAADTGETEGYLLASLLDPVVTEKRLQFETKLEISIDLELARESYGLFAKVQPVEFRRMVSNLVNNAVEAGDNGKVSVGLAQKDEAIVLTVSDTGKGIPPEILAKLGQRGETHGKAGGSGLGLYHARTTVEGWGGSLAITSEPGKGTTVAITLPKAKAPAYFVGELRLLPGRPVLVLDDEPGIHEMWRGRFEAARLGEHKIEALYFSEPGQLRAWVKENPEKAAKAVCLFDYELAAHTETGLSLAEELNLCGQTILVTSRSEETRVIEACAALKVRMIPKAQADLVPVSVAVQAPPSRAVLLDDSNIVHMTWEMAAEEAGVELLGYTDPDKFMADLGNFPKDMPIYIDSDLGENIKGEKIAAELKEKGFMNLCLATAHPPERFAHLPWLKVRDKGAPWGDDAAG